MANRTQQLLQARAALAAKTAGSVSAFVAEARKKRAGGTPMDVGLVVVSETAINDAVSAPIGASLDAAAEVAEVSAPTAFAGLVNHQRHREGARLAAEPDPVWDNPNLPAGSLYSQEEWDAARADDLYHVFEIRSGSEGALFQVAKAPSDPASRQNVVVNGRVIRGAPTVASPSPSKDRCKSSEFLEPLFGAMLDGCLLLGPKAPTTHPRAITGHILVKTSNNPDWSYRLVRPKSRPEGLSWLDTVNATLSFGAPAPGARVEGQVTAVNGSCDPDPPAEEDEVGADEIARDRRGASGGAPCI